MVDSTAYVGYKLRGVPGAILATLGFVLPSYGLMLILSAFYFAAGSLPWVLRCSWDWKRWSSASSSTSRSISARAIFQAAPKPSSRCWRLPRCCSKRTRS